MHPVRIWSSRPGSSRQRGVRDVGSREQVRGRLRGVRRRDAQPGGARSSRRSPMAGWKGVLSLSIGDRSKGLRSTFWESEEAFTDSEGAANKLRGQAAEAGGDTITGVERYEVVLDEAPTAPQ